MQFSCISFSIGVDDVDENYRNEKNTKMLPTTTTKMATIDNFSGYSWY